MMIVAIFIGLLFTVGSSQSDGVCLNGRSTALNNWFLGNDMPWCYDEDDGTWKNAHYYEDAGGYSHNEETGEENMGYQWILSQTDDRVPEGGGDGYIITSPDNPDDGDVIYAYCIMPDNPQGPAVDCNMRWKFLEISDIRLADGNGYGSDPHGGRVEVYHEGVWGTVCNDIYSFNGKTGDEHGRIIAELICKQLGYSNVDEYRGVRNDNGYTINTQYGPGSGQIWLDDLTCVGTESTITECGHNPWGSHNCVHTEDITVQCSGFTGLTSTQGEDFLLDTSTFSTSCDCETSVCFNGKSDLDGDGKIWFDEIGAEEVSFCYHRHEEWTDAAHYHADTTSGHSTISYAENIRESDTRTDDGSQKEANPNLPTDAGWIVYHESGTIAYCVTGDKTSDGLLVCANEWTVREGPAMDSGAAFAADPSMETYSCECKHGHGGGDDGGPFCDTHDWEQLAGEWSFPNEDIEEPMDCQMCNINNPLAALSLNHDAEMETFGIKLNFKIDDGTSHAGFYFRTVYPPVDGQAYMAGYYVGLSPGTNEYLLGYYLEGDSNFYGDSFAIEGTTIEYDQDILMAVNMDGFDVELCINGVIQSEAGNVGLNAEAGYEQGSLGFGATDGFMCVQLRGFGDRIDCGVEGDGDGGDICSFDDMFKFDWEELTANGNSGSIRQIPEFELLKFDKDETDLSLNIEVKLELLSYSSADDEVDASNKREFNWPVTYVLDFEDYDAHENLIYEPGTCQNRDPSSFYDGTTPIGFSDRWKTSLNTDDIGSTNNMLFPPTNSAHWDIIDYDCESVTYRGHFTWQELRDCKQFGGTGAPFTTVDDEIDATHIHLRGVFYINVVSPFWYNKDLSFYRVYQILSKPFIFSISKSIEVLGSAGINLMTISIIAVYKEGTDNNNNKKTGEDIFRLIVLTEAAEYLALSNAELFNYGGAYEGDLVAVSDSVNGNCLGNKNYICSQLWEIRADNVVCSGKEVDPSADDQNTLTGGIDFSGQYTLEFDTGCIADHPDEVYCGTWLDDHPDIKDGVKLTATLTWRDYICDPILFEVQFGAVMIFYPEKDDKTGGDWDKALIEKDANGVTTHLYQVGEAIVFVEIDSEFPSDTYHIFDTTLLNVWICTFAPGVDPGNVQDYESSVATGCLSDDRDTEFDDDFHEIYSLSDGIEEHGFDLIDDDSTDILRFKFKVPNEVQRDTLYVHAVVEVTLNELERRRLLVTRNVGGANQIGSTGDSVGITHNKKKNKKNKNDQRINNNNNNNNNKASTVTNNNNIYISSSWITAIAAGLAVLLTFNIILMCYMNCSKNESKRGYTSVTVDSDDFDSSEANPINVNAVSSDDPFIK